MRNGRTSALTSELTSKLAIVVRAVFCSLLIFAWALPNALALGSESGNIPVVEDPLIVVDSKFIPQKAAPGQTTELKIEMTLVEHYKAYVERFKLKAVSHATLKIDVPRLSPITQFMDTISKSMKDGIKEKGTLKATVEVPLDFSPGDYDVEFALTYQACTTEHCLFPKTIPIKAKLTVSRADAVLAKADEVKRDGASTGTTAGSSASSSASTSKSSFESAMAKGLVFAFAFVFFGGILTSLTPCVYPMIPITLAVIGARTKGQTRWKSFTLSVTYVLGIAVTYSILGVVAASTGALFGAALSNIYVVTGIAVLFVAMGLSMYGLFEIQAPTAIRDRLGTTNTGNGYSGVFFTGLISGVVASPCIGPVLVTILTWIAQTGSKALGFGLLFTFALGMGVLLIVLGTFSHLLNKVPKSGPWMESTKFVFGTAMVAMALYYIEPLYPTWLFHALLALALVLIASVYGAFDTRANLTAPLRLRKGAMIVTFAIGLLFALSAVNVRAGLNLAFPGGVAERAASANKLNWQPYSDELVAQATQGGKPVLIDFYADWCAACKELEELTFPDERVRDLSEKFALLKIDATEDSDEIRRLKQKYGVIGLPTMIFYDTSGTIRADLTVTGFEDAETFSGRMRTALSAAQTAANE
ncbi:MAG: protein-disulfide reductase DsbD [Bdellovibrionaceae bacterium]|nr:protein-disulfide reductase DsbD [Pseudobdellovibrionaceae bacterium]